MGTWSCSTGKGPCWISSASSCSSEGFWFLWRSMIRYWAIDQQMKESVQCNSDPLPRTGRTMENCTEEVSWSKNGGGNLGNLKKICRGAKKSGEWRIGLPGKFREEEWSKFGPRLGLNGPMTIAIWATFGSPRAQILINIRLVFCVYFSK